MMDSLRQDLRYATRALLRAPGFTIAVVLTLALGIGGNAAVFSALRAALLAEPPYPEPDRIMALDLTVADEQGRTDGHPWWSFPKLETMRALVTSFDLVAVRRGQYATMVGGSEPVRAYVEAVNADYFPLFGAAPLLGRLPRPDEDGPGVQPRVVVLTHAVWQEQFGGDSTLIGRAVRVSGTPLEVIGVLQPGFRGISGRVDAWVPVRTLPALGNPGVLERRWAHSFAVFGRRRADVTPALAAAELAAAGGVVDAAHSDPNGGARWGATAVSLRAARANAEGRTVLAVIGGAVALVLLLACVNIANMLLARAAGREREIVIRTALGAGRGRIARQLVTESLLLAVCGGTLGLLVAWWGVEVLRSVLPPMTGPNGVLFLSPQMLGVDGGVVAFAAVVTVATGLVTGLAPASRFSRPEGSLALRQGASAMRGLGSLRRPTIRGALVVAEVALAVVLLAGAGLMLRTMARLAQVHPGFEPAGLLSFSYGLPPSDPRAGDPAFHQLVLDRLRSLPGVQAAALSSCAAMSGCYDLNSVKRVEGLPPFAPSEQPSVRVHYVSDDYFRALGVPVLTGRAFGPGDHSQSAPVMVISATAARRLFGDRPALGRGLSVSIGLTRGETMAQVIGIVGDVKQVTLRENPVADAYVSMRQEPYDAPATYLRTAGDPLALVPAVRVALRELAPDVPVFQVTTERSLIAQSTLGERLVGWSLAAFACLALVMAVIGVYGVVAYSVGQRRREVAVRLALGAEPERVRGLIHREGMTLVGIGAVVGLAGALALGGTLASLLFGVAPRDPLTLVGIMLLLLTIAAGATFVPARRAARLDPMTALRAE